MSASVPSDTTVDRLLEGLIELEQPRRGYRIAEDALLLVRFASEAEKPVTLAVELGTGPGLVALALARLGHASRVLAVEREPAMAALARANIVRNALSDLVSVAEGDAVTIAHAHAATAELVVANPPYWHAREEETQELWDRMRASKQGTALETFLQATRILLAGRGRACFVWPANDLTALLTTAAKRGLHGKRARFVHPAPDRPAARVLVEFKAARPGGLVVLPPWFL